LGNRSGSVFERSHIENVLPRVLLTTRWCLHVSQRPAFTVGRIVATAAALVAVAQLGGCGGGDEGLSRSDYELAIFDVVQDSGDATQLYTDRSWAGLRAKSAPTCSTTSTPRSRISSTASPSWLRPLRWLPFTAIS
jgi:hypothetical protein